MPAHSEPEPSTEPTGAPDGLMRVVVRGLGLSGAGYLLSQSANFVAYLVLARLISPRAFGLYAAGTLITGIGGLFAESGMLAALIKREERFEQAVHTAFVTLLITGTALSLGSLALSPLVGLAFGNSTVTAVTAVLSGWLLIRALTIVPDALLQRNFSFARRVVVDPLGVAAYAGASIPLAAAGAGVWALVAGAYASIIVQAAAAWVAARFRPRPSLASMATWRELAAFTRPLVIGEILRRATTQVDVFALGRFAGPAPLGQYRNGMLLAQQPGGVFSAVASYVILPAFTRISGDPRRLNAATRRAFRLVAAVFIPISVALIPFGVPVAVVLLGRRWHVAGEVIAGASGLALCGPVLSVAGELMKATGLLALQLRAHVLWLAAVILTVTPAAILGGALEVSIALSVSTLGTTGIVIVALANALKLPRAAFFAGLTGPLVASAVMGLALLALSPDRAVGRPMPDSILILALDAVLGALVYVSVLMLIDAGARRRALWLFTTARRRLGPSGRSGDQTSSDR